MNNSSYNEQESFWSGEFGDSYTQRSFSHGEIKSNIYLFHQILRRMDSVLSFIEFGCNLGMNLEALRFINPEFKLTGIEINTNAVDKAKKIEGVKVIHDSILSDQLPIEPSDCVFTKGVLIHIDPADLDKVYKNLVKFSTRYVLVCEYFNTTPVEIDYRGNQRKLFKRDFAYDLIKNYNLELIDYGFVYRHDPNFVCDDQTWFLLKKY